MYRIQDSNNRFIKKTVDNKITFTYSESLADIFPSEREANDFLRKMFNKKARKKYRVVKSENDSSVELIPLKPNTTSEESTANLQLSIDSFDETIHVRLDPEIEKYSQKLQEYDGKILDIRHWLRDENTRVI